METVGTESAGPCPAPPPGGAHAAASADAAHCAAQHTVLTGPAASRPRSHARPPPCHFCSGASAPGPPRPPRIPDYPEFATVAVRHAPLWEVTYDHGSPVPYAARNRVTAHRVAVNDVELLDHVLTEYQPPHGVRCYLTRT